MICCGIEIAARRAICVVLTLNDGRIIDLTGRRRPLEIGNDEDPAEVCRFRRDAHAFLEDFRPDRIGIVQRRKIGTFASGGITFKLEGLIQLYPHQPVGIVPTQSLRAFAKEKQPSMNHRFAYQKNAYLLARYLIHQAQNNMAPQPAGGKA